ncbi:ABC transporter ATP-binding protein [Paenibacillus sp. GCM10027626]|uniref:ABC transporter ATP-binding protein n=1 Tax=Paenibacillus sp. GCM10027626 TaxID=3273411 RepID=UPI00363E8660
MADPILQLEEVGKTINKQEIIRKVSLAIGAGRVLALCGGNGAGKSTILRMITGITQPTAGKISVNGLQWKDDRKRYAAQIGYMPDDYQFSHGLSAKETLAFWAALRRVSKARVQEVLELVGLADVSGKAVSSYSKGMRQRLLFAQALLAGPPLLIMDEPTNGLDPYWMDSFVELVRAVKREGHAVIFSTHQLQIADAVADDVIFLKAGQIARAGSIESYRELDGAFGLQRTFTELFGYEAD